MAHAALPEVATAAQSLSLPKREGFSVPPSIFAPGIVSLYCDPQHHSEPACVAPLLIAHLESLYEIEAPL
jgi:hypothetical protein